MKTGFTVYPNPSDSGFNIETEIPGTLKFYDVSGKLLESRVVGRNSNLQFWKPEKSVDNIYFVRYISKDNRNLGVQRLVIKN